MRLMRGEKILYRLHKLFEAIDAGDTELYWTDKRAWEIKHGYLKDSLKKYKRLGVESPQSGLIFHGNNWIRTDRKCFGNYEPTSKMCSDVCVLKKKCYDIQRRKNESNIQEG